MASIDQARDAKAALKQALAGHDGVTGIGLTRAPDGSRDTSDADRADSTGDPTQPAELTAAPEQPDDTWCLQVNVVDADAQRDLPQEIEGVAVVVRVTGQLGAG
ncbi:hypothetical protein H9623_05355 [Oerskovia sp. Sa1BUA8]|uniref:Uncharacterized protein n=1 Tax=Oerskovia douganii TaxID=2762210 RepID=A0A9D5U907_9CELL|nr:hypothetical protein [Oerskovia douganii]MBE7699736.1 hypothetical protein [Oerskovia douganii]